jgi:membrane peptidoglycan carboxypeptidase
LFFALLFLVGCGCVVVVYERTKVPPISAAAAARASIFYYRDGTELAQVGELDRVPVKLTDVPLYVRNAVLAAEDRGFYHDPVVSPRGLARAAWVNLSGGATQGGSGIVQQYVKVAYLNPRQTIGRKVNELFIATKLSSERSKDWIFEQYLNTVYFGRGAYGIEAAAKAYFGKDVRALTPAEGALLAAVINAPSVLDPALGHLAKTQARWRYVIKGMSAMGAPPPGPAPVFPSVVEAHTLSLYSGQRGYLIEQVISELHSLGFDDDDIYRQGLRVTTTFDPRLEAAATADATQRDRDIEVGLAAVQPGTGEVLASYGGRNYLSHEYDNAFLATIPSGSAFYPFILAATLTTGFPSFNVDGRSPQRVNGQTVRNDDGRSTANVDLPTALADSYNTVFARLALTVGAQPLAGVAAQVGLGKPSRNLGLGTGPAVTAVDQAAAYASLADGEYAAPHVVRDVRDLDGHLLRRVTPQTRQVLSGSATMMMTKFMHHEANGAMSQAGTTTSNAAGWFSAVDPGARYGLVPGASDPSGVPVAGNGRSGAELAVSVVAYRDSNRPLTSSGDVANLRSTKVPAQIGRSFIIRAAPALTP